MIVERNFSKFWESTIQPGIPSNIVAHWREYTFNGVQRGKDIVSIISQFKAVFKARVLDMGCGYGGASIAMRLAGGNVFGIDIDPIFIKGAEIRAFYDYGLRDIILNITNAENTPFMDNSFDIIVCSDLVEHVTNHGKLIHEVFRLLKSDGICYFSFPNYLSPTNFVKDPHYGLLGISILPPSIGRWYVTRLRKKSANYAVGILPIASRLKRIFSKYRLSILHQAPRMVKELGLLTSFVHSVRMNFYPYVIWILHKH